MLDYGGISLLVTGLFTGLAIVVKSISEFRCRRVSVCSGVQGCAGVTCECAGADAVVVGEDEEELQQRADDGRSKNMDTVSMTTATRTTCWPPQLAANLGDLRGIRSAAGKEHAE